jgi:riboflavin kinase/FMN adenylyltransferase
MKVAYCVEELKIPSSVVTIGNYDGVHLGHREIISRVLSAKARNPGSMAALITFDPHPADVLYPSKGLSLLTDLDKKLELLEEAGLDAVLVQEFTLSFARQDPRDFVSDVILPLNVKELFVGHDFAFGKGRAGNAEFLKKEGQRFGFTAHEVEQIKVEGERVGSTMIRALVEKGDMEKAARMLGRPHSLRGVVTRGAGRGMKLGFPTCNIELPEETLPSPGVYATRTSVAGKIYDSATHVGITPTFNDARSALETHLFGFDGDIHGERIEVMFIKKLRDTVKFNSADELVRQIDLDCSAAKKALALFP